MMVAMVLIDESSADNNYLMMRNCNKFTKN